MTHEAPRSGALSGKSRSFWAKPVVWLSGVVVAALGVALTNWLVPGFTRVLTSVSESGGPVTVLVAETETYFPLVFPAGVDLTEDELASIGALSTEDQRSRLKELGAVSQGEAEITLTITGNRADGVRIVDVAPVSECTAPPAGTIVHIEEGFGATEDSTWMYLAVDDPTPEATHFTEEGVAAPFFPAKTIALKHDEQVVVVVVASARSALCSFELELTIVDGEETVTQRVSNAGDPFVRAAYQQSEAFEHVYLGGNLCIDYVEVDGPWTSLEVCGPGNTRPLP